MTDHNLTITHLPINELAHLKGNPRKGDVEAVAESMDENGIYQPIIVNLGTKTGRKNEIIAGNHRALAAKQLGHTTIPAIVLDLTETEATKIALADNRTSDLAEYDHQALLAMLDSLDGDTYGTGYDEDALDELRNQLDELGADLLDEPENTDTPPEPPAEPIARPGDLFYLGKSRVYCGDSTDPKSVDMLFGDKRADMVWTDPPYGVDYVGKTKDALTIQNDGAGDLETLLTDAYANIIKAAKPGAPVYIAHSDTRRVTFETTATNSGLIIRQNLIWCKNQLVLGRSDYQYRHEPILYGFTPGGVGRLGRGGDRWYGDNSQTTVFEVPAPQANRDHPTMKPLELIRMMLTNSMRPGGIVFDPFGGSGSTLLAAHLQGGHGYLIELDPRYVDVICRRYQELTGELPIRRGETVDFTNQEEE